MISRKYYSLALFVSILAFNPFPALAGGVVKAKAFISASPHDTDPVVEEGDMAGQAAVSGVKLGSVAAIKAKSFVSASPHDTDPVVEEGDMAGQTLSAKVSYKLMSKMFTLGQSMQTSLYSAFGPSSAKSSLNIAKARVSSSFSETPSVSASGLGISAR